MFILQRNLDVRNPEDRLELFRVLAPAGIKMEEAAISFALDHLSDDWFELKSLDLCPLVVTKTGSIHALQVSEWARLLQFLYEFRNHANIGEQIRRLCLRSHEKLDTILVVLVAGRYHRRNFDVTFEPKGIASTDLLLCRNPYRFYVEIKRENPTKHQRQQRMLKVSGSVSDGADRILRPWLKEHGLRIEVKFSRLFSDDHVPQVIREMELNAKAGTSGIEKPLASVRGSTMILLPRKADFFYERGMHSGVVRAEQAGTPVQAFAPESMLVRCTFDAHPNLQALGKRIKEAGRQLARDLAKEPEAGGFIVAESLFGGEESCKAIQTRFWRRLPERCWGVTLISYPGYVVPRSDLTRDQIELLTYAAIDA
jgi:hypothetical protein